MDLHLLLVRFWAEASSQAALAAVAIALHSGQGFRGGDAVEDAEQQRGNGSGASISVVAVDVESVPRAQRGNDGPDIPRERGVVRDGAVRGRDGQVHKSMFIFSLPSLLASVRACAWYVAWS